MHIDLNAWNTWVDGEEARRRLEDNPPPNTGLLPEEQLSNEYTTDDGTVRGDHGPESSAIRSLLAGACAGLEAAARQHRVLQRDAGRATEQAPASHRKCNDRRRNAERCPAGIPTGRIHMAPARKDDAPSRALHRALGPLRQPAQGPTMKLPEPVRQAWLQHRKTLLRIAGEPAKGRLLIGGGTVLSARWGHRLSEDIDVLLPDRKVVSDTHPGGPNDLAQQTGGRIEGKWRDRIKIRVEHGVLDICAMQPEMQGLERSTTVEDETATLLSTAQILRGKTEPHAPGPDARRLRPRRRLQVERRALQHAVNALDKTETDLVRKNLQDANDEIANAAENALKGVTKEFETDLSRLGINAADAVGKNRYTRVRIVLEGRTSISSAGPSPERNPPNRTQATRSPRHCSPPASANT